jgi:hypothetical protein
MRQSTKTTFISPGAPVVFYRAALPLSSKTLTFTSGIIRRHRAAIGSSWRKLNSGQQALLVLAYLRKGETFAHLAAGVNRCLALSFDRPLGGLGGGLELPQRKRRRRMRRNRRVTRRGPRARHHRPHRPCPAVHTRRVAQVRRPGETVVNVWAQAGGPLSGLQGLLSYLGVAPKASGRCSAPCSAWRDRGWLLVARVVARRTCGTGAITAIMVTGPWHSCRQGARSTGPGYF